MEANGAISVSPSSLLSQGHQYFSGGTLCTRLVPRYFQLPPREHLLITWSLCPAGLALPSPPRLYGLKIEGEVLAAYAPGTAEKQQTETPSLPVEEPAA